MTTLMTISLLAVVLGVACWHDVRIQRIPNGLVAAGTAVGVLLALLAEGIGLASSASGFAVGLAALLPFYLLRVMGAGDVKLMATVGAVVGYPAVLGVVLATLIAGGVLAVLWAAATVGIRTLLHNLRTGLCVGMVQVVSGGLPRAADVPVSSARMPYALAIAAGTAAYLAFNHWNKMT